MKAYILLEVNMGQVEDVVMSIRELPGVISSDPTFGVYDVIAGAEVESLRDLGILVMREIQCTPGVNETYTCLAID